MNSEEQLAEERKKFCYVGAPKVFALELAARHVQEAFKTISYGGIYLVGSCLERPNWRDVDVRFIMPDEEFAALFPNAYIHGAQWEFDARWLLMTTAISKWFSDVTGLPVDFQFQPAKFANEKHDKMRLPLGLRLAK